MSTTPNPFNDHPFYQLAIRAAAAADLEAAACTAFVEAFASADEDTRLSMFQAFLACDPPDANPPHPPPGSGRARDRRTRKKAGRRSAATKNACVRCGSTFTANGSRPLQGTLCTRCYLEVPYSTDRVWEVLSEDRLQAALKPPVLKSGVPFISGAVPTERDGWCWTCGASTPAGRGEVVWEPMDKCQHALCTACVWATNYDGLWPALTADQAVGIAARCLPMRVLAMAAFVRGYPADAVVGGAITWDVRARLSDDADAFDAAASRVPVATDTRTHTGHLPPEARVGNDPRTFPGYLPPELVGWHEFVPDSGHCCHAVLAQQAAELDDEELLGGLVPLPVGVFGRCQWAVRAGFVIVRGLTYDDELGVLGCLPSDEIW